VNGVGMIDEGRVASLASGRKRFMADV
jgi:hypothetical protein